MNRLFSLAITMEDVTSWLLKAGLGGVLALVAYGLFELACRPGKRPKR